MTVQTTDVFLVERAGVLYQVTAANADSKVQDSDILLVNRAGVEYHITGANFKAAAFQDADLYLVNRAGTDYKATGAEVKQILKSPPVITSVTLSDSPQATRFTNATFESAVVMQSEGRPACTKSIKAWVQGTIESPVVTDTITAVGGTAAAPVLTFTSNHDLSRLAVGDHLIQDNSMATDTGVLQSQDFSPNKFLGTVKGAAWQTAQQHYYGGAADFFGRTAAKMITIPSRTAFAVGTGDFTVCFWTYHAAGVSGANQYLFNQGQHSEAGRFSVLRANGQLSLGGSHGNGSLVVCIAGSFYTVIPVAKLKINTWVHYAIVRRSGILYGYVDGVLANQIAGAKSLTAAATSDPVIGNFTPTSSGNFNWNGYAQDLVIAKSALWSGDFTPPTELVTSTNALASWANVPSLSLALPMNTTIFGPVGTVDSIAGNTVTLSASHGTWGPANDGHYAIGPEKPDGNVKLFCLLDSALNVTDLQKADPGYTTVSGTSPYTIKFPDKFPNAKDPDTHLPAGSTLTTEVQASNASGTVQKASNTVTPA